MSYQGSPFSNIYGPDDYELDEDEYMEEDRDCDDQEESDEGDVDFNDWSNFLL